jgi:two-component system, sensor histidine kinase YesM
MLMVSVYMKLRKYFFWLNYKNKLILALSLIITISILFIGFFNYYETSVIIQKDIEKLSSKNLREVNLNLERYFDQYEQIFFAIVSSPEYSNWLTASKGDELNIGLNYVNIKDHFIVPVTLLNPEAITISLLSHNGNVNTYYLKNNISFTHNYSIQDDNWIISTKLNETNIVSEKNSIYMVNNNIKDNLYIIRLVKKLYFNANASGYIVIDVAMETIKEILEEMKYADSGEGMLLNQTGKVMAHTDTNRITENFEQDLFNREIKDKDSGYIFDKKYRRIIVFSTVKKIGWKSVAIIPYDSVAEGVGKIWSITLVVMLCSIALSILLIVIISTSLTKRIKILGKSMKQMKSEGFGKKVNINGNDEISELAETYNMMLDNLEKDIHELAESKLLQQQAVLSALQAQINSHFLYNTLEFINSMAYIAGQKEIRKAVVSLAKMFRYTSNYKETLVTIQDEINHLKDYLNIMEMQMGDRLHYDIKVEEGIEDVLCLKAIIQPIVENSIKHGLEIKDTTGHIEVKAGYCGDYAYVSVYDDGKGFSEEKLKEVKNRIEAAEEYNNIRDITKVGLINVNYRMKVFYNNDPETGLSIDNIWKRNGTLVQLAFPLRRKGDL